MRRLCLRFTTGLFLFFYCINVTAQGDNSLTVEGKISVQEGNAEGAVIRMNRDGEKMDNYGVGKDGRYKLDLAYNHKFELIFEKKNNFSQKMVVETDVPNTVAQSNTKFPSFPIDINLFTEIPDIDKSFSEKAILKIYYSQSVGNFISDLYYNDAQIEKLIDQAMFQSKEVDKEASYLSKLTRAEKAELRREYNQLLEQAGNEYSDEQFLDALDGYKAASKILPDEQFPKDRIAEINDLLGLIMAASELDKALNERFTKLVKEADLLFEQKKYSEARNVYHRALSIQPNDTYALGQVEKIAELLNQQQIDAQYNEILAKADNSFKQVLYNEAKTSYEAALVIKPDESYPKSKIAEINRIFANQAKDIRDQKNYKQAMFKAGGYFTRQFYDDAMASYQNALKFKPGDPEATEKVAEIQQIMQELSNQIQYDELIKSADKAYKKKQYPEALEDYKKALVLLSDEKYPRKRIDQINEILNLQRNFADLVYEADNQFIAESYESSKSLYQKALELKAVDKHSQDRIREIDGILASEGTDKEYNTLIAQADDFFDSNDYENAIGTYNKALSVKPKEQYPKNKVAEINSILQLITKNNKSYEQAIAKADGLFEQKNYSKAKMAYTDAGQIKPDETYPPEMIAKLDGLIAEQERLLAEQKAAEEARLAAASEAERARLAAEAEAERIRLAEVAAAEAARLAAIQAEKNTNYTDAIARADDFFNNSDYQNARIEYNAAIKVKPDEVYPKDKISEIDKLMLELRAAKLEKQTLDKNYADLIQQADKFFISSSYAEAKETYQSALELKKEEVYPKEKMAEIDEILKQLEVEDKYRLILVAADGFFKTENYSEAKEGYMEALSLKSEEQYPKNQLAKIDDIFQKEQERILAEQLAAEDIQRRAEEIAVLNKEIAVKETEGEAELTSLYNGFIQKADAFFDEKHYNESRAWYYQAMEVKPDEPYPPKRIDEIKTLVGSLLLSQRDRDYQKFIDLGDSTFRSNELAVARGWYNNALSIKGNEAYPKNQISEIQNRIAERMDRRQFDEHIAKASNAFEAKNYNVARFWYKKALELHPGDASIKERLIEIAQTLY
ncbi:hypothetical protein N9164_00150 [Draconibacterium sp.]|nr:hypothetical protein [Draconibacterium sp.]